jgi:glycosyltransferase involved in cell wall biosynthesis
MSSVTACVVARDEAEHLAELLPTLRWADEVLVVIDDATGDDSGIIAEAYADRVETRPFISFSAFRNVAMDLAGSAWIFFVDADERVSPALADEVRAAIAERQPPADDGDETATVAYWVPRLNIMFGRLVRGGGWYPDEQLRLLRRDAARYDEAQLVHESAQVNGKAGHLTQPLLHLNYRSFRQFFAKQERYTAMEAATLIQQGVRPRRRALLGTPLREFTRRFFVLRGWMDGPIGLFLSLAMAYCAFQRVKTVRRAWREIANARRREGRPGS